MMAYHGTTVADVISMKTTAITLASLLFVSFAAQGCTVGEPQDDAHIGDGLATDSTVDPNGDGGLTTIDARVCSQGATTKGIDVSKYQGNVDWNRVKADGVEYAFIRVSDGSQFKDAKFARNWDGTKAAGIVRGAYQFFRPAQNVNAQADIMIAALATWEPGDLPPVIDVEATGGLSAKTIASKVRAWTARVEAAIGVKPIVYTGKYFWRDEVGAPTDFADNALWIAQYTSKCPDLPAPWATWTFWQYSDKGKVAGITGNVDINRFNGTVADLKAFANSI
jgi:lysozyme